MSNVLQRQLQVSDQPDASAMGAAMIGFKSLGGSLEFNETQPKLFLPDVSVKSVYERQFLVYENLYSKLKDVFHELNRMKL
jgi:sugar (pentulose or hexulose) kinase